MIVSFFEYLILSDVVVGKCLNLVLGICLNSLGNLFYKMKLFFF